MAAGTAGLPLTSAEAQLIVLEYSKAATGTSSGRTGICGIWRCPTARFRGDEPLVAHGPVVNLDEVNFIFEYCWSPFARGERAGHDCDVVLDPVCGACRSNSNESGRGASRWCPCFI
jgi:hypothetical protein